MEMGFADRIRQKIKSGASAALAPAPDPRITHLTSHQKQRSLRNQVAKAIEDVAAAKQRLQAAADAVRERLPALEDQARTELKAGRETMARLALQRRHVAELELQTLDRQLAEVESEEVTLAMIEQRLTAQIEAFAARQEVIKARFSAAEAQVRINEAVTGVSEDFAELSATLQQAEERTESLQSRATAIDRLVQDGDLSAISPTAESLDVRLGLAAADEDVERQLSALARDAGPRSFRAQRAGLFEPSACGRAAGRLLGLFAPLELRNRSHDRAPRSQSQLLAVVVEGEWFATRHRIGDAVAVDRDFDQPAEKGQAEGQALDSRRQAWGKRKGIPVVAHGAEPVHDCQPCSGQRSHVNAFAHVVLEVAQVHQRRLAEVVVRELEVADLGRDDRLRARRKRRVAHGDGFVIGEVPRLLLVGECVPSEMHRQHEVCLLDDLLAIEVEVGEVKEERVLVGLGPAEIPALVVGESARLLVDLERLVVGDEHLIRRLAPGLHLRGANLEPVRDCAVTADRVGGGTEISLRHQVRVEVVVLDRAVFVWACDAVNPKMAVPVVVSERDPEPGCYDQELDSNGLLELQIVGRRDIPEHSIGDVGVDVKSRCGCRPVARALLAVDRPPRECRTVQPPVFSPPPLRRKNLKSL